MFFTLDFPIFVSFSNDFVDQKCAFSRMQKVTTFCSNIGSKMKNRVPTALRQWKFLVAVIFCACVLYVVSYQMGDSSEIQSYSSVSANRSSGKRKLSVVINTFKRHEMMLGE